MPDSVWETVGTSQIDWKTSSSEWLGQAGFSPVDGGPVAGKYQSHCLSQEPRGCAGFSLGDAGAGRFQSRGQLAYHRQLEDSSHD